MSRWRSSTAATGEALEEASAMKPGGGSNTVSRWDIQQVCSWGIPSSSTPGSDTSRSERPNSPTSASSTRPPWSWATRARHSLTRAATFPLVAPIPTPWSRCRALPSVWSAGATTTSARLNSARSLWPHVAIDVRRPPKRLNVPSFSRAGPMRISSSEPFCVVATRAHQMQSRVIGGAAADHHRHVEHRDELLQVERLGDRRDVLTGDDRPLDHQHVEPGLHRDLVVLEHALRRQRGGGNDFLLLDLAYPLRDQLGLDRLPVDLLHLARGLL